MKRSMTLVFLLSLACASVPHSVASDPVDWGTIGGDWSYLVVTIDPDGDERVTRVWIALSDGDLTIRTNESRWWSNLERDPTIRIRVAGIDHLYRAEPVENLDGRVQIDEAFFEKYGRWESTFFPGDRGATHDNYARLRR